jgi:hypothetical protein
LVNGCSFVDVGKRRSFSSGSLGAKTCRDSMVGGVTTFTTVKMITLSAKSGRGSTGRQKKRGGIGMIGGNDIVFGAVGDSASLEACARIIRRVWPHVRFEDAVTGDKYKHITEIPFGSVRELLAYLSKEAEASWDADSPDSPENSMLYIIVRENDITVVLDDPDAAEISLILEGIRGALWAYVESTFARAA